MTHRTDPEVLLREIHALNRAWKAAENVWGAGSGFANNLRELKNLAQRRLVEDCPTLVRLRADEDDPGLLAIDLVEPVGRFRDGCHIPARLLPTHVANLPDSHERGRHDE